MPIAQPPSFAAFVVDGVGSYWGEYAESCQEQFANGQESRPDLSWSFVDSARHFHAFDSKTSTLPTLRSHTVRMNCNGLCGHDENCEGYDKTLWHCRICGERVRPEYRTVDKRILVARDNSWGAVIHGPLIMPSASAPQFSVLIQEDGKPERFGVAQVTSADFESGNNVCVMTLDGIGVLGWRPLRQKGSNE